MIELGESYFNYIWKVYDKKLFILFFHTLDFVMGTNPKTVLEVGVGDHTVSDFLERKGIAVSTMDIEESLRPTYVADIKKPLPFSEKFDTVILSNVLEHQPIKFLPGIMKNISEVAGKYVMVALPYTTLYLFPRKPDVRKLISCEGFVTTGIPIMYFQPLLTLMRGIYRVIFRGSSLKKAFRYFANPEYPEDDHVNHHWDLGFYPTTRGYVKKILRQNYEIVREKCFPGLNTAYYLLKKKQR